MPTIVTIIIHSLAFFLPAIAANITPVLVTHYNLFPQLRGPIDQGYMWRDKRLFGDNKTIRGLMSKVVIAALIGLWQGHFILGATMGFGALWGDLVKSFFKRRLSIAPGHSWRPWDQIDFALGAIVVSFPLAPQSFPVYLTALMLLGLGSYLTSYFGVKLGYKEKL